MQENLLREDFDNIANELEILSKEQVLRIEIDSGLEGALRELQDLEAKLPKEQMQNLMTLCKNNVIDTITGQFGLASVVLSNKDGGNVHTTHNVRQGIYANEKEANRYENRGQYDPNEYHTDTAYINRNKQTKAQKEQGDAIDYMTGKKINPNDKTDLDHVVSAKSVHNDRARVLAEQDGAKLANTESNLRLTDSNLNRMKQDKSAQEFLQSRENRIKEIQNLKQKEQTKGLSQSEKDRLEKTIEKLEKQQEIDDEKFLKTYNEEQKKIDKAIDKAYYTSTKPYKEAIITSAKDGAKIAVYSAIGIVLRDFVEGMFIEIKEIFKQRDKLTLKEMFVRFKDRMKLILQNLKAKWKDIFAGSLEAGLLAFFSNIVIFVINIFATTSKRITSIIRAGFVSLYQALKVMTNPPNHISKKDIQYEALKILTAGIIGAVTMSFAESISIMLKGSPLAVLWAIHIPFTSESLGDALSITLTAIAGGILTTIAIYYMDKWRSPNKNGLQIQIMTKHGEILQYRVAQSWFMLKDGYEYLASSAVETTMILNDSKDRIKQSNERVIQSANDRENAMQKLRDFYKNKTH